MNLFRYLKSLWRDDEIRETLDFFLKMFIFKGIDKAAMSKVYTIMYHKMYHEGEIIFRDGAIGKAIFFIYSGEVEVLKNDEKGHEIILTRLSTGDFFGEMALLEELPRSATVRVSKPGILYLIYKVNFDSFVDKNPKNGLVIYKNLVKILSARLRITSQKVDKK